MAESITKQCITKFFYLKESDWLLPELTRIIIYYLYHLHYNHKLLFVDNDHLHHIRLFWPDLESKIEKNYPYLQIYHIKDSMFDCPKIVKELMQWDTMLIFIPKDSWDKLMAHPNYGCTDGIQIYNGYIDNNSTIVEYRGSDIDGAHYYECYYRVVHCQKYNPYSAESYWKWLLSLINI